MDSWSTPSCGRVCSVICNCIGDGAVLFSQSDQHNSLGWALARFRSQTSAHSLFSLNVAIQNRWAVRQLTTVVCNRHDIVITSPRLGICEKALAEYLETKRLAFPRFYFVSSADLLDILSKGNQPVEVSRLHRVCSYVVVYIIL